LQPDGINFRHEEHHYHTKNELGQIRLNVAVQQFDYYIPFEGDSSLFTFWPNRYSKLKTVVAHVLDHELRIVLLAEEPKAAEIDGQFSEVLGAIQEYLQMMRDEIAAKLPEMDRVVVAAAKKRKDLLISTG